MSFGQANSQGFNNPGPVIANKVITFGPGEGVYAYSPNLGPGKLVATAGIAQNGHDSYGNAVLVGNTDYFVSGGVAYACQVAAQGIAFYTATSQAGPYTLIDEIFMADAAGDMTFNVAGTLLFDLINGNPVKISSYLALLNTSAPAAVAGESIAFANGGALNVIDGTDGAQWDTQRFSQSFENITITAVTPANTNVGSAMPVAARQYLCHARFAYGEAAAGVPRFGFTTTATVNAAFCSMDMIANQNPNAGVSVPYAGLQGSPFPTAYVSGKTMAGGNGWAVDLWLRATFTSTGNLQFVANTSAMADSYGLLYGHINLYPSTA